VLQRVSDLAGQAFHEIGFALGAATGFARIRKGR